MTRRLFAGSLDGEGVVALIQLSLTPEADMILPPFTSRTLKSLAGNAGCLEPVWRLYNSTRKYKPVTFRVLETDRGTPLYKKARNNSEGSTGNGVITIKGGSTYYATIALYARSMASIAIAGCNEMVDVGYGRFHLALKSLEIKTLDTLGRDDYERIKLEVRTPLTITTKIMSPPVKPDSQLAKLLDATREAYRLMPTPAYLAAQAARQWLGIVRELDPKHETLPYAIGRLADIMVAEVHYNLKPVTALYGRDESGKERHVRGVIGTVVLEPVNDRIKYAISRLLEFSSYMGLGKSRSMGFGEVRIEYTK